MRPSDLSLMIGGPAGSGVNSTSEIFMKACSRAGVFVFTNVEYHSNIHGRHIFFRIRTADESITSHVEQVDVLLALDAETIYGTDPHQDYQSHRGHLHEVVPGGAIVIDAKAGITDENLGRDDVRVLSLPYDDIVREAVEAHGVDYNARRHAVMANMVPLGACCALLDFDVDRVLPIVAERLPERHQNLVPLNRSVLQHAWQAAHDTLGDAGFSLTLHPRDDQPARMLIAGHEAIGIAKLHAGCGFQTYYPIAPASDESVYLESLQADWPIVVLQAEDEIASMNMAVGAAHAGIRASTSTAGPGFTLMAEGMGFASITEAPGPVVVLYQRGGPSTGLPTRNSQQDLRFALQPAHGEFPHIVVAPGDVEEAAQYTHLAFNWGDRYQVPVVVLADKFIANSHFTVDSLGLEGLPVDRGAIWTGESNGAEPYRRHQLTASGVSPRSVPGTPGGEFVTTSDEHTERGRIEEDIDNRIEQMDKRMGKLDIMLREIPEADQFTLHGSDDADLTIVSWGSTRCPIRDAVRQIERESDIRVNNLQIRLLRPFPADAVREILERANRVLLLEDNYTGQLGLLIAEQTGIQIEEKALKYTGRPFSQDEVAERIRRQVPMPAAVAAAAQVS